MRKLIFLLTFCMVFSGCTSEYRDHYIRQHSTAPNLSEAIRTIESSGSIWILPDLSVKQNLLKRLDTTKERIWIEIYTWTDKDILDAVIRAHKRGVDVRVILEPNVYGTPRINTPTYKSLTSAGINVVYADGYRYTFTHAKFLILDNEFFISTGNLTYSFFTKNRDILYSSYDPQVLEFLSNIFLADSAHQGVENLSIPQSIVISPTNARQQIDDMILSAQKRIIVYTQTLSDPHIISLLEERTRAGIRVSICTAQNDDSTPMTGSLTPLWTRVKKPYIHAKVMIVDGRTVFIGSQNFSQNSIENNREIGIILRNPNLLPEMYKIIEKDCKIVP